MMLKYFIDVVLICAGVVVIAFTVSFLVSLIRNFVRNWRNQ